MMHLLSTALVGGIAAVVFGQVASAADLAVYSWTGFYAGLNAGGAWGRFDPTTTLAFHKPSWFDVDSVPAVNAAGAQRIGSSGFTGGGQIGYNWQTGAFVLGLETDFQYFNLKGSANASGVYPCCAPAVFVVGSSVRTEWLWTLRPRLGYASNNWLFYVTGGLAVTDLRGNFTFNDNCGDVPNCSGNGPTFSAHEAVSLSTMRPGGTVGGGIEAGLWGNWTFRAEYLYTDFGSISRIGFLNPRIKNSNNNPFTHTIDLKANLARVAVNYRF